MPLGLKAKVWHNRRMAQAENKTRPTDGSVENFLSAVDHVGRREDAYILLDIMKRATGYEPVLWGSMVGFGQYHYKYDSGREGDMFLTGFAPRKAAMTTYIMPGFGKYDDLMGRLGKFKTGSSCLYIGRLKNVDLEVLEELISLSVQHMREKYGVE